MSSKYSLAFAQEQERLQTQSLLTASITELLRERWLTSPAVSAPALGIDLGCAWGDLTRLLFRDQAFTTVIGLDRDATVINGCSENERFRFREIDLARTDFAARLTGYIEDLGPEHPTAVVVSLYAVVQHLEDPVAVLRQLRQALPKQAQVIAVNFDDGLIRCDQQALVEEITQLSAAAANGPRRRDGTKLSAYFKAAGFSAIEELRASHELKQEDGIELRRRFFTSMYEWRSRYYPEGDHVQARLLSLLDRFREEFLVPSFSHQYVSVAVSGKA